MLNMSCPHNKHHYPCVQNIINAAKVGDLLCDRFSEYSLSILYVLKPKYFEFFMDYHTLNC